MQPGPHQHQHYQQPHYQQPGQPYPQQPYGFPQPPKKGNGPVIALAVGLAVLLIAGIGVFIALTSGGEADGGEQGASSEGAGPADKYTDLPECAALNSRLTAFPEFQPKAGQKSTNTQASRGEGDLQTVNVKCYWRTREPEASVRAEITLFRSDSQPRHNGTEDGAQYWLSIDASPADRKEGDNILFPKSTGGNGCYGRFTDGNVLVTLQQEGPGIPGGATHGPEIDRCRDDLRPKGQQVVAALKG